MSELKTAPKEVKSEPDKNKSVSSDMWKEENKKEEESKGVNDGWDEWGDIEVCELTYTYIHTHKHTHPHTFIGRPVRGGVR